MSSALLLGIDEGTTAVKAALFDDRLRPLAEARRSVAVKHPHPGWVEQDPEEVLSAVVDVVAEVLAQAEGREIRVAGLDHQGESVLAWDALTGRALTPILVWQDKRQLELLAELDPASVARSGLPLDPYFSAGKLAWLLAHDEGVQRARDLGRLRMGTVDAFIVDRLGGRFATDLSTASRTQLLAVGGQDWDEELLALFGVRREWLPRVGPSFGTLGELRHERWPTALALGAQVVDQQAALAGSGAVRVGELKATYGTGVFVLGLTAAAGAPGGLLPTVAWAAPSPSGGVGEVAHALDGGVFTAGALLDWLAQELGLEADTPALMQAAASVGDSAGVLVLPALAGLGAPWWQTQAKGVIAGLHAAISPAHVARAALEAIAWRVADIVEAASPSGPIAALHVDGGLSNDATLLQIQADAIGQPLNVRPADSTVLGAAMLAGVGAGIFPSLAAAAAQLAPGEIVEPTLGREERVRARERWRSFVALAAQL